jgi:hypothetical protein
VEAEAEVEAVSEREAEVEAVAVGAVGAGAGGSATRSSPLWSRAAELAPRKRLSYLKSAPKKWGLGQATGLTAHTRVYASNSEQLWVCIKNPKTTATDRLTPSLQCTKTGALSAAAALINSKYSSNAESRQGVVAVSGTSQRNRCQHLLLVVVVVWWCLESAECEGCDEFEVVEVEAEEAEEEAEAE